MKAGSNRPLQRANLSFTRRRTGKQRSRSVLKNETVWLTQKLMAELFQKDVRTVNEHITNIYDERELMPEATVRKFRTVQNEGNRQVGRDIDHYNLDVITSDSPPCS